MKTLALNTETMRLYRYMRFDDASRSLRDGFFCFSSPSSFNDPFECRPCFLNAKDPIRRHIHENYERLRFEAIRQMGATTVEDQALFTEEYLVERYQNAANRSMDWAYLDAVDSTVLVMCFTDSKGLKPNSDVLFWSHYADSGKGVRISFDLNPHGGEPYDLKKVNYTDDIPVFDCSQMESWLQGKAFKDYILELVHHKGKAWEYENEVRMILPRHLPPAVLGGRELVQERNIGGKVLCFAKFGYDTIRRVDYGPRTDRRKVIQFVKELRGRQETAHIDHRFAVLDETKYAYMYKKVVTTDIV